MYNRKGKTLRMWYEMFGAFCAFICGGLVSTANYFITKAMTDAGEVSWKYYKASVIRLAVNVVFVVMVFFLSDVLPWKRWTLLLGAAAGFTLPLIVYTALLIRRKR